MRDVIVIGAGPVGSHLAEKFSRQDRDVMVIERSSEIGDPLACSGHVSPDIKNFVPKEEWGRLYQNEILGARFHVSDEEYSFYGSEVVSYVIDRVELDKLKAEQAQETGAQYHLGETVQNVTEKEDKVVVETDEKSYEAKIVAGCDGASSTVRDQLDLPEPDHFYQGILCFTDEDDDSDFVDVTLDVPSFFGWRIPRTDSVEYGAAVPQGENPMEWLEEVTEKFGIEEYRRVCAGAIPIGPPGTVTSNRVFLAGDAAAQTKPFTGGGILYGMRAAGIAAEEINPDSAETLEKYEKVWREELMSDIRLGRFIEKVYSMPSPVQKIGMNIFEGEIGVHMDRPTSLFSKEQLKAMLPFSRSIKRFQEENEDKGS